MDVTQTRPSRRSTNCLLLFQVINKEQMTGSPRISTCIWWRDEICFKESIYQLTNITKLTSALLLDSTQRQIQRSSLETDALGMSSSSSTLLIFASFSSYSYAFYSFFLSAYASNANYLHFSSPPVCPLHPLIPVEFCYEPDCNLMAHLCASSLLTATSTKRCERHGKGR